MESIGTSARHKNSIQRKAWRDFQIHQAVGASEIDYSLEV